MTDMHFNRLQDSVHPVANGRALDGKYQSLPMTRKTLLIMAGVVAITFLLAILITFLVTRAAYTKGVQSETIGTDPDTGTTDESDTRTTFHQYPTTTEQSATTSKPKLSPEELRLPSNLTPDKYELVIKTYLPGYEAVIPEGRNFTFDGTVKVHFHCKEATDKVVLNQKHLTFINEGVTLTGPDESVPQLTELTKDDEEREMVTMRFDSPILAGQNYTLQFKYMGNISNEVLNGLYLSKYKTPEGVTRYLAVTQMEPTDARRMVPCFDEPSMKTRWKVVIEHPKGSVALSNGKETGPAQTSEEGWLRSEFEETVRMSSYLLAVIVCDFDYTEGTTNRGTRFRIWARKSAKNETKYALGAGIIALEFFEDFYNISYPMPKQDMIALPDFEAGAMENWGLITYREKYLLYDENIYTLPQKRRVAVVVAHELAHQWFGNLVTMKWWDDLWLNEGFATFMEYLGTDAISDNKFNMDGYFVIDALENALAKDQQATSHPLFVPIASTAEINEVFDGISYDKGGSVLRMIDHVITREGFKKGLNVYLNKFKYDNAGHNDLWNSLSETVPASIKDWDGYTLNVTKFAASWTEQMGYPVVNIKRKADGRAVLTQERFKLNDKTKEKERYANNPYGYQWEVPIFYTVDGAEKEMEWLRPNSELMLKTTPGNTLIVNPGAYMFYRVNYAEEDWEKISKHLGDMSIDTKTRAQLIEDGFTLAEANKLDYSIALSLTSYLDKEKEYIPWSKALRSLAKIKSYYKGQPEYLHVQKYLKGLIMPLGNVFKWDNLPTSYTNDSRIDQDSLHASILAALCELGDSASEQQAANLFKKDFLEKCKDETKMSSECSSVPLLVRGLIYCEGVKAGGQDAWDFVFSRYKKETNQLENARLMSALACTTEKWILERVLDMALDGDDIRKQDIPSVFVYVARSDTGALFLWDYFQENWDKIYKKNKESKSILKYIIYSAAYNLQSAHKLTELETFIENHKEEADTIQQFGIELEGVKTRRDWIDKNYDRLAKWFEDQNKKMEGNVTL